MKKSIVPVLTLLVVIITTPILFIINFKEDSMINTVLSNEYYSYLPVEAKDYIKDVYEKTGTIIYTEKNKKSNVPYLNPTYVEYLILEEEEKQNVDLIPNPYVLEYIPNEASLEIELPSSYDLRNVNGKNFLTPLKNQKSLGICWSIASLEQAESYLMVKNNKSYTASSQKFSERQLDYATSTDGILNYTNPFGRRKLGEGGNFSYASEILSYGISAVDEKVMPFDESLNAKSLAEILNYKNAKYEVDSTLEVPRISTTLMVDFNYSNCNEASDVSACVKEHENTLKEMYGKEMKNNIMKYGGGVAETISPESACAFRNKDGNYVIEVDDTCYSAQDGHAMQAIGWDDNYEYYYCDTGSTHTATVNGRCRTGTLKKGTGAYILRNSWGDNLPYVYLTYDSFHGGSSSSSISFITSLSDNQNRSWDNSYPSQVDYAYIYYNVKTSQKFQKNTQGSEKLEKIKFNTGVQNGNYFISIVADGKTYSISNFETSYPGIYTVDLSDKNIIIKGEEFSVTILSTNRAYLIENSISAYTSNIDKTPIIATADMTINSKDFTVYSETRNIASSEKLNYTLLKGNKELDGYLNVKNNKVAMNNVNANLELVKFLPNGKYTLRINYGEYFYDSNLVVANENQLEGNGTTISPYLIHSEKELERISMNLGAYYKLENDIVLSSDWTPVGTEDFPFTGGLDGNGHTISELKVVGDNLETVGLFGIVKNSTRPEMYIKNITIKNASVTGKKETGILIGKLDISNSAPVTISSIYLMNGEVNGDTAGSFIGRISGTNNNDISISINDIFSSATITGISSSGLIGKLDYQGNNISISNIQNVGVTISEDDIYNTHSTSFIGDALPYYDIHNFIITGFVKNNDKIFSYLDGSNSSISGTSGYYLKFSNDIYDQSNAVANIISVDSSIALKNKDNYNSWINFDKYWKMETIDGIARIPVLKGVNFEYTKVSTIEVNVDEDVSLTDFISPVTDVSRLKYEVKSNEENISITLSENADSKEIRIRGLKPGKTTFHLISDYDGFEKDVEVTVKGKKNPIVYYYNGLYEYKEQITTMNTNFQLEENTFTKEGYKFSGWNTDRNGNGTHYANGAMMSGLEEDLTLYAEWIPIQYKVVFHSNDDNNYTKEQVLTYDKEEKLLANTFSREGYRFVHWNTSSYGIGTKYVDEQSVHNLTKQDGAKIHLYAVWSNQFNTIYFNANGGVGKMDPFQILKDEKSHLPKNTFVNEGYVFTGWSLTLDGTGITYQDEELVESIPNGTILYAQWKKSFLFKIEEYIYKDDLNLIYNIPSGITQEEFLKNILLDDGFTVQVDLNDSTFYTGSKTKIYYNNHLYKELLNVIKGDVNGDGKVSSADYVKIRKHIMQTDLIKENIYFYAADINNDDKISSADYVKIRKYIMNGGSL